MEAFSQPVSQGCNRELFGTLYMTPGLGDSRACARGRWSEVALASDRTQKLALARDRTQKLALARDRTHKLALARDRTQKLALARDRTQKLALVRDRTHKLALARDGRRKRLLYIACRPKAGATKAAGGAPERLCYPVLHARDGSFADHRQGVDAGGTESAASEH
ncbi:MAG TPA: hypothetical protein VFA04_15970 [Bryobacteraceae bacterium]|nr:hypothetical protein [Bryobacteraceae bacterium]